MDNLGRVWIEYAWPSVLVACKESLIDGLVRLIFWDTRDAELASRALAILSLLFNVLGHAEVAGVLGLFDRR